VEIALLYCVPYLRMIFLNKILIRKVVTLFIIKNAEQILSLLFLMYNSEKWKLN